MNEPLFVFIALAGATILGFLFSTALWKRRSGQLASDHEQLLADFKEREAANARLQSENEAKLKVVENLQKTSHDAENQLFEKEAELKLLRSENARLQEEVAHLTENPVEKVREIDVIREVPILVLREVKLPESRVEKAKKLMNAFKKGYLDEHGEVHVSTESIDESL